MKKKNAHTRDHSAEGQIRLSLSMIVKNEEARLAECLESMKHVADEIVIVDTGSTDRTIAIARAYGARVIEFPWNGSFSDARNTSLSNCRGEWVIFLDADERLEKASVPTLRRLLRDPSVSAYEVCVVSRAVDERK
ncbi:MAG TPA: glycosyltransferase family 2 protein, partial [Bacteroidota bacterium]|nr:glycosyltransferase family 2 protein [Bacteroidota bacterium]